MNWASLTSEHPISSDKGNNDYYVENERKKREAMKQMAEILVNFWRGVKLAHEKPGLSDGKLAKEWIKRIEASRKTAYSVDCDDPHRDSM